MPRRTGLLLLPLWIACAPAAFAASPPPAADKPACEVWQRELSFAQSVQRHDAAAFAGHVMADAIFDANTPQPTRGLAAVRQHWAAFIAGKTQRVDWYPQQVVASGDGTLAYSSGAYLFENLAPGAKPRYVTGRFATVWRRAGDGAWRVAFDGGDAGKPANDADVAAFHAGRQPDCPAAASMN
jgi:ketosteroid isomerase-like protein